MSGRSQGRPSLRLAETGMARALGDSDLAARVLVDGNPRARRISLRVDPSKGAIVLVHPPRANESTVTAFLVSKADWIAAHLETLSPHVAFGAGAVIPYGGVDHIVRLRPEARGGVWREETAGDSGTTEAAIIVTGRSEHAARRLRDWLKAEAGRTLTPLVHALAATLGVAVTRVTVRDTRSRWGSCSRDGKLSFSWRLIMAPAEVLAYVAAHEVAHLKHMDHSPAFWRTVAGLLDSLPPQPDHGLAGRTLGNWSSARQWLRRSGSALHRYG